MTDNNIKNRQDELIAISNKLTAELTGLGIIKRDSNWIAFIDTNLHYANVTLYKRKDDNSLDMYNSLEINKSISDNSFNTPDEFWSMSISSMSKIKIGNSHESVQVEKLRIINAILRFDKTFNEVADRYLNEVVEVTKRYLAA